MWFDINVPLVTIMQSNYEPPDFLWDLVEKSTPEHEREEIKRMLGEDLVDQSIELHDEVIIVLAFLLTIYLKCFL